MPSPFNTQTRIFVAGHRGLVGAALVRVLKDRGYKNLILKGREEFDLSDMQAVKKLYETEKPEAVIIAAAHVGGIVANQTRPYDFIYQNLQLELNLIHQAHEQNISQVLFLGSSCIYPKMAAQPIVEEALLTGPLESTNRPYALAKIAGIELCWALNRQFGRRYFSVMPTNLYGVDDNFDLTSSHVLPALLRKFHEAKAANAEKVEVWGSGQPLREFLYSDDLAEAIVFLLELPQGKLDFFFSEERAPLINVGSGSDLTIAELAGIIQKVTDFRGRIEFDSSKPDGTPRKLMDSSKIKSLGWQPKTQLEAGIRQVYEQRFTSPSFQK